jgi:hypothetical protein
VHPRGVKPQQLTAGAFPPLCPIILKERMAAVMDDIKPWQQHTAQFIPRAMAVGATTFEFMRDHLAVLPQAPLAVRLSEAASLKYQLAILVIGTLRTAQEIATSSSKLWLEGHFLLASIGIRTLIELNGRLLWAEKRVLAPLTEGAIDVVSERVEKLLLGSKSAIPLARGDVGPRPLINVMEFVRAAEAARPGAMSDYEFLCDSAHPSYMMQTWMLFAGPDHDNWTNETFAAEVGLLLNRILGIAEGALVDLESLSDRILVDVVPAILAETGGF